MADGPASEHDERIDACPVCHEAMDDDLTLTVPCTHRVCLACFVQLETRTCPLCRRPFDPLVGRVLQRIRPRVKRALIELIESTLEEA